MQRTLFLLALAMILVGASVAALIQSDGGDVRVLDVRFPGAAGNVMSGLIFVPGAASAAHPAPGVLAIHGYINSRETQSGFAIELARRGFVVLALDQSGHGYSDPPAMLHGFGGPDGLAYLRGLSFVDADRIGLEGHSMGGWAVQMAAAANPGGYASMVLAGSSTGTFGAPEGTPQSPRNLLLVFSRFDEFSGLMWGSPIPREIVNTAKLKTLFGTNDPVEEGRVYGNVELGTARLLAMPAVTHPGDHISSEAIGATVDWMQRTLDHESSLSPMQQTWYWKELATLIALVGIALLIFPLVDWLLRRPALRGAITAPAAAVQLTPSQKAVNLLTAGVVPVLTFFPLQAIANLIFPASALFPQQITNGVLLWAWGTGLIALGVFAVWYRGSSHSLAQLGLPGSLPVIARALTVGGICCGILYAITFATEQILTVDFRFWVVALKRMSADQFIAFLIYLPFFAVFFVALAITLHGTETRDERPGARMWRNCVVLSAGFIVLLVVQYLPLLMGGTLAIASQPLLTIVAFQFVPLMLLIGLVSTFCFARTHNVYTGAFINAIFVTWYMVAGTATQALPFWM